MAPGAVKSYGSLPHSSGLLNHWSGTDAPVCCLLWLLYAVGELSGSAFGLEAPGLCGLVYSLAAGVSLAALSSARSPAWCRYGLAAVVVGPLGFWLGLRSGHLGWSGVQRIMGALMAALALGHLLPLMESPLIGSSKEYSEKKGWGWEPMATEHMHFAHDFSGTPAQQNEDAPMKGGTRLFTDGRPQRVIHDLLYHRAYWSGEAALDYMFFLANEHSWFSCIAAHPWNPYTKLERIFMLFVTSCLSVFPLALFQTRLAQQETVVKLAVIAVVVTLPRSLLKIALRKAVVADEVLKEEALNELGGRWKRLVRKHFTEKSKFAFYRAVIEERMQMSKSRETVFVVSVTVLTLLVSVGCVWGTEGNTREVVKHIAFETLFYAFVLELLQGCLFQARPKSGRKEAFWFLGFFGRWYYERDEYGRRLWSHKKSKDRRILGLTVPEKLVHSLEDTVGTLENTMGACKV